jgi:hypothetical protein
MLAAFPIKTSESIIFQHGDIAVRQRSEFNPA